MAQLSEKAQVAKLIREELKAAFPRCEFKINATTAAFKPAVRIEWTEGAAHNDVKEIVKKYAWEINGEKTGSTLNYLSVHSIFLLRDFTWDFLTICHEILKTQYDCFKSVDNPLDYCPELKDLSHYFRTVKDVVIFKLRGTDLQQFSGIDCALHAEEIKVALIEPLKLCKQKLTEK